MNGVLLPHPSAPSAGGLWVDGTCVLSLPANAHDGRPHHDLATFHLLLGRFGSDSATVLLLIAGKSSHDAYLGWLVEAALPDVQSWTEWGRDRASKAVNRLVDDGVVHRTQRLHQMPDGRLRRGRGVLVLQPDANVPGPEPTRVAHPPAETEPPSRVLAAGVRILGPVQVDPAGGAAAHDDHAAPHAGVDDHAPAASTPASPTATAPLEVARWGDVLRLDNLIEILRGWDFDGADRAIATHGHALVSDAVKVTAHQFLTTGRVNSPGAYVRRVLTSGNVAPAPEGIGREWLTDTLDTHALAPRKATGDTLRQAREALERREAYVDRIIDSLEPSLREQILAEAREHFSAFFSLPDAQKRLRWVALQEDLLAERGLLASLDGTSAAGA